MKACKLPRGGLAKALQRARVGKRLPDALYVHRSALAALPADLRATVECARQLAGGRAEVVKISRKGTVSFLSYPGFETQAHPELERSAVVNVVTGRVDVRDYTGRSNPPILHRKELFLRPGDPRRAGWAKATAEEEKRGLYRDTSRIGTKRGWRKAGGR